MKHLKRFNENIESKSDTKLDSLKDSLKDYIKEVDKNWNYITSPDLKKALDKDPSKYFLLDIRKPEDFKSGHIKGSKNIFWKDLLDNLDVLPKDKKIVLICYVGQTSSQMLVSLSLLKYDVISLKFGMGISPVEGIPVAGWLDYGYPIV
jgi:rhodanese-related sulfurtransferase